MARGNIIEKHHKTHHFKNHDSLPTIDGGEREVAVKVNLQGPSKGSGKGKGKGEAILCNGHSCQANYKIIHYHVLLRLKLG